MVKVRATRSLENAFRRWGFHLVAGCDEVGRGCLAGPVVAGAVILDPARHIPGLFDSKMTTAIERERLYDVITRRALAWAVASASPLEIDRINIHRASLDAMRQAIGRLEPLPDMVVVDAFKIPDLMMAQIGVPKGDRKVSAVAAASIVAKVTRDRLMIRLALAHPGYGFERHMGYSVPEHFEALRKLGPTIHHRRSFSPVALAYGDIPLCLEEDAQLLDGRRDALAVKGGPFELAYGSAQALPVALPVGTLVPGFDPRTMPAAFATATPGEATTPPALAALKQPIDTRRWLLWSALGIATLVLGWMAWSLSRQMRVPPKP